MYTPGLAELLIVVLVTLLGLSIPLLTLVLLLLMYQKLRTIERLLLDRHQETSKEEM